jgi:hypothetical protein
MGLSPFPLVASLPLPVGRAAVAGESPVVAALGRCRPLFRQSVLVVVAPGHERWDALRFARAEGACVTALCSLEQADDARAAGAAVVLDPERTDPTWYRGWSVIVDPERTLGFRKARRSLRPGGAYVTGQAGPSDRALAALGRLAGGPRLLDLRG